MSLIVCPLHDVEAIARVRRPSHILSLISPSAEPTGFDKIVPNHLELRFNDIAEARENLIAPSTAHIRSILDFAHSAQSHGPLLIHCWAGVSRSTAAAYMIACQRQPESTQPLAERLRQVAPYATPNALMTSLADTLLGADGNMKRSIQAIGRGHETMWGSPFDF